MDWSLLLESLKETKPQEHQLEEIILVENTDVYYTWRKASHASAKLNKFAVNVLCTPVTKNRPILELLFGVGSAAALLLADT